MTVSTFHTYPDLVVDGGRLAATDWTEPRCGVSTAAEGVAAILQLDAEAVVLRVVAGSLSLRGLAPGGLAA